MWDNANLLGIIARWLFRIVIVLLLVALGVWLYHSPYFPIKQVKIEGEIKRADTKALQDIAQKYIRGNILKADLNSAQEAFAKLAWVAEADVRRKVPDTVEIIITEHEPIAHWSENELVGSKGEVFTAESDEQFPVFSGTEGAGKTMVQHYHHFENVLLPLNLHVEELVYTPRSAWSLKLNNGIWVKLGRENEDKRLQRFATVWPSLLAKQAANLEYVDMRYKDGFAVKHHSNKETPSENEATDAALHNTDNN